MIFLSHFRKESRSRLQMYLISVSVLGRMDTQIPWIGPSFLGVQFWMSWWHLGRVDSFTRQDNPGYNKCQQKRYFEHFYNVSFYIYFYCTTKEGFGYRKSTYRSLKATYDLRRTKQCLFWMEISWHSCRRWTRV